MMMTTDKTPPRREISASLALACSIVLTLAPSGHAQCDPEEVAKLLASDGSPMDKFGSAVAIDGDRIIVGAPHDADLNGVETGAAYIYARRGGGWTETAKLVADDGADGDQFGATVSISGDRAVVGAFLHSASKFESGAAYVFTLRAGVWSQTAKLVAADAKEEDRFGGDVFIDHDSIVVSAPGDDDNGDAAGAAYAFTYGDGAWVQESKLLASDGYPAHLFGIDVAISGDVAIVGAHENYYSNGSAYIFTRIDEQWVETVKLRASDGEEGDYFGLAVGVSGDAAIVGAFGDDDRGWASGCAYIFERIDGEWLEVTKLLASDGVEADWFGADVSIDGEAAVVGAHFENHGGSDLGAAYVFANDGTEWKEVAKLTPGDGEELDFFGTSVAISGESALGGANFEDENGASAGAAYVFDLRCGPGLVASGSCPGQVTLQVNRATPGRRVAFLYAQGIGDPAVPKELPCAGVELGLDRTAALLGAAIADDNGQASITANAPARACGRLFVQAIDLTSCVTTNVVGL